MPGKGKRKDNSGKMDRVNPPLKTRIPVTDHPEPQHALASRPPPPPPQLPSPQPPPPPDGYESDKSDTSDTGPVGNFRMEKEELHTKLGGIWNTLAEIRTTIWTPSPLLDEWDFLCTTFGNVYQRTFDAPNVTSSIDKIPKNGNSRYIREVVIPGLLPATSTTAEAETQTPAPIQTNTSTQTTPSTPKPKPSINSVSTNMDPPPTRTYKEAATTTTSPKKTTPSPDPPKPRAPQPKGKGKAVTTQTRATPPPRDSPLNQPRAIVFHAAPMKYKPGLMRRWIEEDNQGARILGIRWLLQEGRRVGKLASSLVIYLAEGIDTRRGLRMGRRVFRTSEYEWDR
ncbi:hypothetical protein L211DRAFT_838422 [Terfezia boudieri ATCC MYA-4762]|uniref:Uncharacterized protein n=1 Tax=Terfezia boudieri ATCC MYA-4762 TaxID=1051890 RepID=A0A3N4LPI9_9PEZI|nr:hypothetical protein L211DRAFT_838422 [Terfezia boudieri ATCC MYA-4762]